MKKALSQVLAALVLVALGFACWTAGEVEQDLADAHETLAVLRFDAVDAVYADLEQSVARVPRVPRLTDGLIGDVEGYRATANYWQGRYDAVAPNGESAGDDEERGPALLALAANAAYRTSETSQGNREALLRRLDAGVKAYGELLTKVPGDADVAYNYEFLVRTRDTLSKARASDRRGAAVLLARTPGGRVMAGDLPDGRTLHGVPGAPPPDTDMSQFKMHIPLRPEEREENEEAGEGAAKARKG